MKTEMKKLSSCLNRGAIFTDFTGEKLFAISCDLLIDKTGQVFHAWQRGDCETCDTLPKLDIAQFSQTPQQVKLFGKVQNVRCDELIFGDILIIGNKHFVVLDTIFNQDETVELCIFELDLSVSKFESFKIEHAVYHQSVVFDIISRRFPKYPTITKENKTFKGFEVLEYDFTDPFNFAFCDVDGVLKWLPVDFE